MAPTTLLTETPSTNTLSPNISLSEFHILEFTQRTQYTTTSLANASSVDWDTLAHQQLTMDPNIYDLKIQYYYACKRTVHLTES